jgi:RND family efflux transporter MFP subunit
MTKRRMGYALAVVIVVAAVAAAARFIGANQGAVAQAPPPPRAVSVEVAGAVRKQSPVILDALGTVTPIASVALKSRLETEIVAVHFSDGAMVKEGDLLFTLDSRAIEAQIQQAEGTLARDRAQLEGAERDVRRYTELVAKNATPVTNLDNAKTQAGIFAGAIKADEALLQNLRVQLSYCTIRAPIPGRMSAAAAKVGNFVRPADVAPLATIIQAAPIYVSFTVPQRFLPELRQALANELGSVEAVIPGEERRAKGQVSMIENAVDAATGMVMVRATMPNEDGLLWPGTLVTVRLVLRSEEAVTVPSAAVQVSQTGTFVFVVRNGVATVQPVKVARTVEGESVIETGLVGGEQVVTDGHLLLTDGARVSARERKAGT